MRKIILLFLLLTVMPVWADESFPPKGWRDAPNPIADQDALAGGMITIFAGQYPKSFNYYLDNNTFSAEVFDVMFETLLRLNPVTLAYEPNLADKWTISDDKKNYTFHLNPKARWSDGTKVTARDVKWTYEAIMDPKNLTGVHKMSLEKFLPPVVIDDHTIRFTAKEVHWRNLSAAGMFNILSQKAYQGQDFNKINFAFPVVSGPYRLDIIKEGLFITLKKRVDWWQKDFLRTQGTENFDILKFKFFAERQNAFEAFKKGAIDLYPIYTSRIWMNLTKGEKFEKNWIVKQKIYNYTPVGFQGFAMNMRISPFNDLKVRKAMNFLFDREKMNQTLMYNQYFLHRSYYEKIYTSDSPCPNPMIKMDKKKARELLRQAGWQVNPKTGILEKKGRPFIFKILTRSASFDKFLAIFAEDLKDVGIQFKIERKDLAAWHKDLGEFNFQMTLVSWGSGIFSDPEGMWATSEADRKEGNNITGFKNPKVDALIDAQKKIFDVAQRNVILKQIDQIIFQSYPYILCWNIDYNRLLYWNKFGTPKTVLSKYGREDSAYHYWWLDEDNKADLTDAMANKTRLPERAASVDFDRAFGGKEE